MLQKTTSRYPTLGILAALEGELAPLLALAQRCDAVLGLDLWRIGESGPLLAVAGVGKVAAAHATAGLLAAGASGVVLVGTGGAVSKDLEVGDLVHASAGVQADLGVREGRHSVAHGPWLEAWQRLTGGKTGLILSSDRAVTGWRSRSRLRKAYSGTLLADMEAAAVAAVCLRANKPWAALKVATDRASFGARTSFQRNFARLAGIPAATLADLCSDPGQMSQLLPFRFPSSSGPKSG